MSLKTLTRKVTNKVGRQVLTVQKHSPAMLFAVGLVGVSTTAVLACRATLKMSELLAEGEELIQKVDKVAEAKDDEEAGKKAKFGVRLQVAIKIAKLYSPAIIVGVASVGALTGSHVILHRRNAALTAAYAIVHKSFDEYRGRVVEDQGKEKDLEYRFGLVEREIVEEGKNGPEVKIVKGLDPEAIKASEQRSYARIFDADNENYSTIPHQNQYFIQMVLNHARDDLQIKGHVFLNDVYDMLGFKRTKAGSQVGWVKHPKVNPETGVQEGDGYIDFGAWSEGTYKGKEWVRGDKKAFLLDFNVDGIISDVLEEM